MSKSSKPSSPTKSSKPTTAQKPDSKASAKPGSKAGAKPDPKAAPVQEVPETIQEEASSDVVAELKKQFDKTSHIIDIRAFATEIIKERD